MSTDITVTVKPIPPSLKETLAKADCEVVDRFNCRQNFTNECERLLNEQITYELEASILYMQLAAKYGNVQIGMPNLAAHFLENSHEERDHADSLMKYINLRGGRVRVQTIQIDAPVLPIDGYNTAAIIKQVAHDLDMVLCLENIVYAKLLAIHARADAHLADFLESNLLDEQVKSQRECHDRIISFNRYTEGSGGLGLALFDASLAKK